jgi:hypothetical protein
MACYISTKEVDYLWNAGGGGDGEQTWPHGVVSGLDKPDLIEVRANMSTQVLVTTADTYVKALGLLLLLLLLLFLLLLLLLLLHSSIFHSILR